MATLIADPGNTISCSVVNLWEFQIKSRLGQLDLAMPLIAIHDWIGDQEGWGLLPVRGPHSRRLDAQPSPHKDPFDRLLIAQAVEEQLSLVRVDEQVRRYSIRVVG